MERRGGNSPELLHQGVQREDVVDVHHFGVEPVVALGAGFEDRVDGEREDWRTEPEKRGLIGMWNEVVDARQAQESPGNIPSFGLFGFGCSSLPSPSSTMPTCESAGQVSRAKLTALHCGVE